MGNVINAINNEKSQPVISSNNSDEYINKLVDDKMKNIVNELQKRMSLVEEENKNNRAFLEEENQQLREELSELKKRLQNITMDNTSAAPLNDCSENKSNINYGIEPSNNEQGVDDNDRKNTQQQKALPLISTEKYADPNYNSSDNEDPRNDMYFD
jgi:hypothetical protein